MSPKPGDRLTTTIITDNPFTTGNTAQFSHLIPRQTAAPLFPRAPVPVDSMNPGQSTKATKPDPLAENKLIGSTTTRPLSPFGLTPFFSYLYICICDLLTSYNSYPVIPFGAQGVQSLAQLQQHQQQLQSKLLQAKNISTSPIITQADPSDKKTQ
jgi:hypothetical protein